MRPIAALCALFCLCASVSPAAHSGSRVEYIGGTRPDIPANHYGEIRVTDETYLVFLTKHTRVKIPYSRINMLEYGQKVNPRYVAALISPVFMLAKKREHFLTIGFQNDGGHEDAMIFRINKDDVRLALVTLEARTGQEIHFQDEDARLAGKS
jgi:hypothetical protein